ncbi:MAG: CoA transferase [Acidimicrobiia bacterium]|nr:CoA transferase [Acidimicrobiia bacterium]
MSESIPPAAPLEGVRVVEFGNLIAAPFCAMLLADLGADVVKVEPPSGDLGRAFGPYVNGESAFFLSANRGKRSVVVDFRTETGRARAFELAASADVVVSNLRHGAMDRFGLDEASVRAANPDVIYAVVSAFGVDGPFAERTGIDVIFQAESGMMSLTGDPGSPPGKTATTIGDYVAATNAALGICAALAGRSSAGRGSRVDVSLRDSLIAVQAGWNAIAFATDSQPDKTGTASPFLAPNRMFETANGNFVIAIVSDRHFRVMCEALERTDLIEPFLGNDSRLARREALETILEPIFSSRPTSHWIDLFTEVGLPCGRVLTLPEVWDDPQVRHNEMVHTYEHPIAGAVRGLGSPIRIDGRQTRSEIPPPPLGG